MRCHVELTHCEILCVCIYIYIYIYILYVCVCVNVFIEVKIMFVCLYSCLRVCVFFFVSVLTFTCVKLNRSSSLRSDSVVVLIWGLICQVSVDL